MKFKEFVIANEGVIKDNMFWDNYGLTTNILPVVDLLKDHALEVLKGNYGKFEVEEDILDEFNTEVMINFPTLVQQMSMTVLMDGDGVKAVDVSTETFTRGEVVDRTVGETGDIAYGATNSDITTLDTLKTTDGTSVDTGTSTVGNTHSSTLGKDSTITNTSQVDQTGSKSVALANQMPEQSITGVTQDFPVDTVGTPDLGTSMVQSANQNFTTIKPLVSSETSTQEGLDTTAGNSLNTTTNNLTNTQAQTSADTGTTTRATTTGGIDATSRNVTEGGTTNVTEERVRSEVNKQYAYEFKAFLETLQGINALKTWSNSFNWLCGIH